MLSHTIALHCIALYHRVTMNTRSAPNTLTTSHPHLISTYTITNHSQLAAAVMAMAPRVFNTNWDASCHHHHYQEHQACLVASKQHQQQEEGNGPGPSPGPGPGPGQGHYHSLSTAAVVPMPPRVFQQHQQHQGCLVASDTTMFGMRMNCFPRCGVERVC